MDLYIEEEELLKGKGIPMTKKNVFLFSGLCAIGHPFAYAGPTDAYPLSPAFSACMDKSEGTTFGMKACIAAEDKKQEGRLNKAYQAALKVLVPTRQKQLRDAQRAWVKFRDADCSFLYDPDGGTLASITSADCFMQKAAQRAVELESLAQTN
jgi:uncharacterized protein YecT (DUF1311 family)